MIAYFRCLPIVFISLLLVACGSGSPKYSSTPLPAGVIIDAKSSDRIVPRAETKKLGVVFSDNVVLAEKYLARASEGTAVLNPIASEDIDPAYFKDRLGQVLALGFSAVIYSETLQQGRAGTDIQMIVDYKTQLGSSSFTRTWAEINGIILDPKGAEIVRVHGKGETTVPFPAVKWRYKTTVERALENFAKNLDLVLR